MGKYFALDIEVILTNGKTYDITKQCPKHEEGKIGGYVSHTDALIWTKSRILKALNKDSHVRIGEYTFKCDLVESTRVW